MKIKPKQTVSGSWNVHVYVYVDGKKTTKSITAKTKSGCIELAKAFIKERDFERLSNDKGESNRYEKYTFAFAAKKYLDIKSRILSPTTITAYKSILKQPNIDFNELELKWIDSERLQCYVNNLISIGNSAKTVRNKVTLIQSIVQYFIPEKIFRLQLPTRKQIDYYIPTKEEFNEIYMKAPEKLKIPILLGGFAGLRRGEVCALRFEDVKDNGIVVNKSMAFNDKREIVIKRPKTEAGVRFVPLDKKLIRMLRAWTFDVDLDYISNATKRLCTSIGLPAVHFHCFRHFFATELYDKGINPLTIIEYTGHSSPNMITNVYAHSRRNIETDNKVIETFSKIV